MKAYVEIAFPDVLMDELAQRAAAIVKADLDAESGRNRYLRGTQAAAEYLGLPVSTTQKLVAARRLPAARLDGGRALIFDRHDLDAWIASQKRGRTQS